MISSPKAKYRNSAQAVLDFFQINRVPVTLCLTKQGYNDACKKFHQVGIRFKDEFSGGGINAKELLFAVGSVNDPNFSEEITFYFCRRKDAMLARLLV